MHPHKLLKLNIITCPISLIWLVYVPARCTFILLKNYTFKEDNDKKLIWFMWSALSTNNIICSTIFTVTIINNKFLY